jgi:hypothetical protein
MCLSLVILFINNSMLEPIFAKLVPHCCGCIFILGCLATDFLYIRVVDRRRPHTKEFLSIVVSIIRVYRAVAWQHVDKIRYSIFPSVGSGQMPCLPLPLISCHGYLPELFILHCLFDDALSISV